MKTSLKDRKKALEYIAMSEGYDGRLLVDLLGQYLKPGSTLLEIGMGPGKDLVMLAEKYRVTGSDISPAFLDLYREKHPDADLLLLDAVTLNTKRRFDCIYSNKVLHQLSKKELKESFRRQSDILNPGGLACHSFWYGDKKLIHKGMAFQYYTGKTVSSLFDGLFDIMLQVKYMEMISDDSLLLVLKKGIIKRNT